MNTALIFAGGLGTRMKNTIIPKQFFIINDKPIIVHTILNFEQHSYIDAIAVVCLENYIKELEKWIKQENILKVKWIVKGAQTGQQSIYNGLNAIFNEVENPNETIVLISDGVRPNISKKIITDNIECVKKYGSSATVYPVPETILELDDTGIVTNIPIRSNCYQSKAPQGFYLSEIINAHKKAINDNRFDFTNSVELMRRYGHSIYTVLDSDDNIKITTPLDLLIYKAIIEYNNNHEQ